MTTTICPCITKILRSYAYPFRNRTVLISVPRAGCLPVKCIQSNRISRNRSTSRRYVRTCRITYSPRRCILFPAAVSNARVNIHSRLSSRPFFPLLTNEMPRFVNVTSSVNLSSGISIRSRSFVYISFLYSMSSTSLTTL